MSTPAEDTVRPRAFDVASVRAEFPLLDQEINGRPLVYLDNAATAQKPLAVLEALEQYYRRDNANVHRGVHTLSHRATMASEHARAAVARFINAPATHEVIWTRGTTESINLVAQSYLRPRVGPGDEIVVSCMEHHSNIVPWQMVCEQTGAVLKVVPVDDTGTLDMAALETTLGERTRMLALVHVSNALGTVNPIAEIGALARERGIPFLVDGAQALPHGPVDVQALGCDFYAFSGHKFYGPTGIGVLWGREALLDAMPPYQGGGEMIREVRFEGTTYNDLPFKFEAGTPHIAGTVGLGAAVEWFETLDAAGVRGHEQDLLACATQALADIDGLRIIGTAADKVSVVSFVFDDIHAHDIGTILDEDGVAVRTGHHCTMPLIERFGVPATVRASMALYNTREDVDRLVAAIGQALRIFRR